MGIRYWIDRNRSGGLAIGVVMLGTAVVVIGIQLVRGGTPKPDVQDQAYYSTDEGATYLAGPLRQPPTNPADGHPAAKAYVFQCAECAGHPLFVNHVERHQAGSGALVKVAAASAPASRPQGQRGARPEAMPAYTRSMPDLARAYTDVQVKKPKQPRVNVGTPQAIAITQGRCPVNPAHAVKPVLP